MTDKAIHLFVLADLDCGGRRPIPASHGGRFAARIAESKANPDEGSSWNWQRRRSKAEQELFDPLIIRPKAKADIREAARW